MSTNKIVIPKKDELETFSSMINKYRLDFHILVFIIFPFGIKGTPLEHFQPYTWQIKEWEKMSRWFKNPETRDKCYKLAISSGNGAAKTAFGAMTNIMLMYTQKYRGRITANTDTQIRTIVWPEYDKWCRNARYFDNFFDKQGSCIKSKDEKLAETWRLDQVTWSMDNPVAISGLHNAGGCAVYTFEEAAGIPHVIYKYASGAMSDANTMKVWLTFANSDDPESYFEQTMSLPDWHALRLDTRDLEHVSKDFVADILRECNGDEDHDDFRVRVRGLPRKSSKDSIISANNIMEACRRTISLEEVQMMPAILTVDPAWTGGDETTIWFHQGPYSRLMDRYKLNKEMNETHLVTYMKLCELEKSLHIDAVLIDQAEGTAIYSFAQAQQKYNWYLISFAASAIDAPDFKNSKYQNMRAYMYYEANDFLAKGGVITSEKEEWLQDIQKELAWTKGARNKQTLKKQAEPKEEIKKRVGKSPDIADGYILRFGMKIYDRLPENTKSDLREVYEVDDEKEYDPYANL